jgi:hypothetical protein
MGRPTHVYANGNEIATKATRGQASACFPDVCFSPPPPPPAPKIGVPIPYPNTCFAKDLAKGSRTVLIRKKLIAKEDKSYFRTSYGDEPATPAFKKGIITSKIKGKCYFVRWSPNVKVESKCVDRHLDMVTHNHKNPPNALLQAYLARQSMDTEKCKDDKERIDNNCGPKDGSTPDKTYNWVLEHCGDMANRPGDRSDVDAAADSATAKADPCLNARKCQLVPYSATSNHKKSGKPKQGGCCPGQTGHHLLPDGMFRKPEGRAAAIAAWVAEKPDRKESAMPRNKLPTEDCWGGYTEGGGLTICAEGGNPGGGSHDALHEATKDAFKNHLGTTRTMPYTFARDSVAEIVSEKFGCKADCIAEQLDSAYGPMRKGKDDEVCDPLSSATVVTHSGMSGDGKRAILAGQRPRGTR